MTVTRLLRLLWSQNHYFLWVWLVLTAIVVGGYQYSFDFERICRYQYCPSSWVLAACVGCLVLGMVWSNIFFSIVRPLLQLGIGQLIGTRIRTDTSQSALEAFLSSGSEELWSTEPGVSVGKQIVVAAADLIVTLLFLMLPVAGCIALCSGIAYFEQHYLGG